MFPGMNPRAVEQAMKKMGIKHVEIPSSEVIIRSDGKDIIITSPRVIKVDLMGQDTFQITGSIQERETVAEISEDDVKTVSSQSGVSEDEARKALEASGGDLAAAIMELGKSG